MMGPDDPSVRDRRISQASMGQARSGFESSFRMPVMFALELVERIRDVVTEAIAKHGPTEDGDFEEEVGRKAWEEIVADPEANGKFHQARTRLLERRFGLVSSIGCTEAHSVDG